MNTFILYVFIISSTGGVSIESTKFQNGITCMSAANKLNLILGNTHQLRNYSVNCFPDPTPLK